MTVINNSMDLVNAINNNASLTVNNAGQIQKQSLLGKIFQKIGDFFSSQSKIEQRQTKLEEAMIKLLNHDADGKTVSDLKSISNEQLSKYSRLKIETIKLDAYAKTASAKGEIATFSREFVTKSIDNLHERIKGEKGQEAKDSAINDEVFKLNSRLDQILKFRTTKDLSKNEQNTLNEVFKTRYQSYVNEQIKAEFKPNPKNKKELVGPSFCDQFGRDLNRQTTIVDGKKYTPAHAEELKEHLKSLFPEGTAACYFMSWCLNQALFGDTSNVLCAPESFADENNIQLPKDMIGMREATANEKNIDDSIFFKMDKENLNYEVKTIKQGKNIVGVEIKAVSSFGIRDIESESDELMGHVHNTVNLKIDLKDPNNPKITSFDTRYTVPQNKKAPADVVGNSVKTGNNFSANRNSFMRELSTKLNKKS